MQILFSCGKPAPDMALRFIDIEYFSRFFRERRVNLHQSVRNIFMYCGFANTKLLRRLPHGGIVIDNIISNIDCSFLNIELLLSFGFSLRSICR